jgi:hypothetical protein
MHPAPRSWLPLVVCAAIIGAAAPVAAAAGCEAASGPKLLPLVELFTSEGCDSCPPADRWLTSRFPVPARDASVLAFHVDYWDRLGWKDRFATAQFTQRQYAAMRAGGETFVYTPQVRVQGRDTRNWNGNGATERVAAARAQAPRAELKLFIDGTTADAVTSRVDVRVSDPALQKRTEVWLAYTESRLVSDIKAGENRGVRLTHDHVVRTLAGPFALDAQGRLDTAVKIALPAERGRDATLVAVAQDARNGEVLQTLSLPVCGTL